MNLIRSLAGNLRALTMEDPAQPLQPYSVLMDMLGMTITDAGMLVNEKTAMRQPTVLACVRVKSQGLSSLPLVVYKRLPRGKAAAPAHRLYPLLHDAPNPQMTSMAWREGSEAMRQLWGNGYTEIQRDRAGRVVNLWPLPSDQTNPERRDGQLRYVTRATPDGSSRFIEPQNMLHVPGMAFDGLTGISPIQLIKQTIGRALAMERFGAQLFGNAVRPSGAFIYSGGTLSPEARENLRRDLQAAASGQNALKPLLLEGGLDWKTLSIPPNEAQFVEAMKEIVADIARGFGVPLHLVQDLSRSTNNNIEQQALEFVMYGLRPEAIKWEQELNRKLFDGTEYFVEHSMEGLLRGDFKTRMEGWSKLASTGAVSPNDICAVEGYNPIPADQGGDLHMVPLNMVPLESMQKLLDAPPDATAAGQGEGTPNDPAERGGSGGEGAPDDPNAALRRERVIGACRPVFRDAVNRTITRSKRDQETVQRIWTAPLQALAQLVALCAAGAPELPDDAGQFAAQYAAGLWRRAWDWKQEDAQDLAEAELVKAYDALFAHVVAGEN